MAAFLRSKCVFAVLLACLMPLVAAAQTSRQARVQITVVDPSNAIVQDATVTVVGLESPTASTTIAPVKTNEKGVAIVENLPPGRYSVRGEFPGFDIGLLRDVRLRAGDNKHVIVLPLTRIEDSVTVGRDTQAAASDRRSSEFGLALTKEQIDALSDDPAELQRQIMELAGPDAIVRVDSFEGQQLPPKAQIKSVRVVRDQFAAEAAQPGSTFVEIVTQPGVGPLRGGFNFNLRDGSMTGRSQFAPRRGPEQFRNFSGFLGGTLVKGKTTFNVSADGQDQYTTPILYVATPGGTRAETLGIRQPMTGVGVSGVIDHALTRDQTLRIGFNRFEQTRENLGIGNFDLPERGYTNENIFGGLRVQQTGPLGRRSFINTRLSYNWQQNLSASNITAPTIIVQDAFTSGGAQQTSQFDQQQLTVSSDIDYVRGMHSWRGGLQIDGQWFDSTNSSNALGTYTFSSLADFEDGRPLLYTRAIGDPRVSYVNLQAGFYVQDDIRVRKGLTLSPGVRYSVQKRVDDYGAFEPRFGFTWSPTVGGKTTLRGSAGIFHNFLPTFAVEQTLRQDGERQREAIIVNPAYPDPGLDSGVPTTTNKYLIGDDYRLARNYRYSAGIDQVISPRVRVNVLYNYIHLQQQPRGRNLNSPVNGVRPDPRFANVIEVITDTEIRRHEVFINSNISLAAPSPALQQKRFNWRRLSMNAGFMHLRARNNSNGFFAVPPTGNIDDDWGPGPADTPYRVQVMMTSTQFRNLTANVGFFASAGGVYSLTTGTDDNGDGLINDRPKGVGLRSLRGEGQGALNMRVQYAIPFGRGVIARQVRVDGPPPPPPPQGGAAAVPARYRLNIFMTVQNVTNHQNLGGYSGVMTSPFFMRPTNATNLRSINFGVGMSF